MTESSTVENKCQVPIWEKFALTVNEAMQYFNIGEKKIRKFVDMIFTKITILLC